MKNFHYLAVNSVGWSANENKEAALDGLEKTNGHSDKVLPVTLFKIYQVSKDYKLSFWMPIDVKFSIIFDESEMIKCDGGDKLSPETILIMDSNRKIIEVGK